MIKDEEDNYDWVFEIASAAGFHVSEDGEISIEEGDDIVELLLEYTSIVSQISVRNYVSLMTKDLIGNSTIH